MIRARFFVAGEPATQGSKRIVQPKGHRRPIMIEVSKKLGPWRAAVAAEALTARQSLGETLTGPVALTLAFVLRAPKRKRHLYPSLDLDKLVRGVGDALVHGKLLADDRQIIQLSANKLWSTPTQGPGCLVTIATQS